MAAEPEMEYTDGWIANSLFYKFYFLYKIIYKRTIRISRIVKNQDKNGNWLSFPKWGIEKEEKLILEMTNGNDIINSLIFRSCVSSKSMN